MQKNAIIQRVWFHFAGYVAAFLAMAPLLWMALAGFKGKTEVVATPFKLLPIKWKFQNYLTVIQNEMFVRSVLLTLIGAVVYAILTLIINSMAAYVFARLEFPFKRFLWAYCIIPLFIPGVSISVTSFIVVTKLHMLDTLAVLILPGLASAAHMFFIRQFYLNIPLALEEAALIDGATRFGIFRHIFLPMSYPVFVFVGVGSFLGYWNSYIWPTMTITNPDLFQIQQYLATFRSERGTDFGLVMAGATLTMIPTLILFLIFQRYIIQGIKISGLK